MNINLTGYEEFFVNDAIVGLELLRMTQNEDSPTGLKDCPRNLEEQTSQSRILLTILKREHLP